MASNDGERESTEISPKTPNPIRIIINQILRSNKTYKQSFKLIIEECSYDSDKNDLTLTFKFKRNGFLPIEALDNTKFIQPYSIETKKPYSDSTRLIISYTYTGNK